MLAHGFPPAGGSGSNRALAFARYLPMFGWRPLVLTPDVDWASNRDDGLLARVSPELGVVRTASLEPRPRVAAAVSGHMATRKAPGRLRRQLGHLKRFPDAHIGWLPFAMAAARRLEFDVIYSSSGPFTSHVAGLALHTVTRKPWVAELRDGWYQWNRAIFPDYPAWRDPVERRLEGAVMRNASRVVLVTKRMADAFRTQYGDVPADHFDVVSNGFDPAQIVKPPRHAARAGVELLHAGALYYGRSIAPVLDALADDARLTLIGTLDGTARAEISGHQAAPRVTLAGYRDHAATLRAMGDADVLLLVANTTDGAEATVPGKFFEYLAVGRPILAIGPRNSATEDLLRETGAGWFAAADDPQAIRAALKHAQCAKRQRELPRPDPAAVARYDRRVLTGKLARIFDDVVGTARRI
jgi:glycosyltransferase involved in cell wall biosynthesis